MDLEWLETTFLILTKNLSSLKVKSSILIHVEDLDLQKIFPEI